MNPATAIHLDTAGFVATAPQPNGTRRLLSEKKQRIQVHFVADGETKALPQLRFELDKSTEAAAEDVGLYVSEGEVMWPVGANLKGM